MMWKLILNKIAFSDTISIPRCYFLPDRPNKVQIHGFSNVSQLAYAAVILVKSIYPNGDVEKRLVTSKTKIALIKIQTIPRLELLGALLLAQLIDMIRPCLTLVNESIL